MGNETDKKSIVEIVLMPLVIALVGVFGTHFVTTQQTRRADAAAQLQQDIAAQNAQAERERLDKEAETQKHLKLLEIFADKIVSKDTQEQAFAVRLLQTLDSNLGSNLTDIISVSGPPAARDIAVVQLQKFSNIAMHVTSTATPPAVRPGERTTISVTVKDSKGNPIPKARVSISAGGGRFVESGRPVLGPTAALQGLPSDTGTTDAQGQFVTWWMCRPCARAYDLNIRVEKSGFMVAKDDLRVDIR